MKKLVLFAAIAFAATMVACGNKENKEAAQEEAAQEAQEVVAAGEEVITVDSIAPDSVQVEEAAVVAE